MIAESLGEQEFPPAWPWLVYLDDENLEELMCDLAEVSAEPDLVRARRELNRLAHEWDKTVEVMRARGEV